MKLELRNKIKEIHKSALFGTFIECGCAATIVNTLMYVNQASNTVFYSYQPYSKIVQESDYVEVSHFRSVSEEFISGVLKHEFKKSILKSKNKVNFCLAASFQLHDGKSNSLTHGWIGIKNIYTEKYYHISIPEVKTREKYLEIISEEAIGILYEFYFEKNTLESQYIDNVIEETENNDTKLSPVRNQLSDEVLNIMSRADKDHLIVFDRNGELIRFEEFCRGYKGIILQKGSFNPFHYGHEKILEETKKIYTDYNYAFFVSIKRYDKPNLSVQELLIKVVEAKRMNTPIIFCNSIFFEENIKWIRKRWKMPIVFPIGSDTANRICESTFKEITDGDEVLSSSAKFMKLWKWNKVTFKVYIRKGSLLAARTFPLLSKVFSINYDYEDDGISSTKIRELKTTTE